MKARLPQGFSTKGNDMNSMIRRAQKMQEDLAALQEELDAREYTVSAGGGAVTVVIDGTKCVKSITVSPDVIDPDDPETLQDILCAAVNEAIKTVEDTNQKEMSRITGSVSMPGIF